MGGSLENKVFLVTGATEGIGKAAALEFAHRGATLALVGRNREKSERVVEEIKRATGNQKIELYLANLARMADIRVLAKDFLAKHDRLDVLVNNAGAIFSKHILSDDGFEMTFALNHMAYFLLTTLLLDTLKKTPGARIVSTSSGAHRAEAFNLDTIAKRPQGDAGMGAYGASKLANILFTRELARRLEGTDAVANCFHPGFVHTGFAANNRDLIAWGVQKLASMVARTPEKGAETLVWLATHPEAGRLQGQYCYDRKVASISRKAQDAELARKLWRLSEELVGTAQ